MQEQWTIKFDENELARKVSQTLVLPTDPE